MEHEASAEETAALLSEIRTGWIGLAANPVADAEVARKILCWHATVVTP
ncbi:MAG: hypothetical protein WD067_01630 [Gaiellaceae bacterium]